MQARFDRLGVGYQWSVAIPRTERRDARNSLVSRRPPSGVRRGRVQSSVVGSCGARRYSAAARLRRRWHGAGHFQKRAPACVFRESDNLAPASGSNPTAFQAVSFQPPSTRMEGWSSIGTSAHAVFDIKYHFVWITKYRYKILRGRVAERARDLMRQICQAREAVIMRGAISPDHIHMLVSCVRRIGAVETGAVPERAVLAKAARRISGAAEAVLGAAPVGAGLLLRDVWARWTRRRSRSTSRARNGMTTIRASRSPRPPSLEPALQPGTLQAASAATPTFSRNVILPALAGSH